VPHEIAWPKELDAFLDADHFNRELHLLLQDILFSRVKQVRQNSSKLMMVLPVIILGVIAVSSLLITQTTPTATHYYYTLWSTDFESGTFGDFTGPNSIDICPGNNPGQISTFSHTGRFSSVYYTNASSNSGGLCRSYYIVEPAAWMQNLLDTEDYYLEVWVYVPSTTPVVGWVSFMSIEYENWRGAVTVDSGSDRQLYIWNNIFNSIVYQANAAVQWPFDKWFKIGVEVHYKPSDQISTVVLFQDSAVVGILRAHALSAQLLHVWMIHFGLYTGHQSTFTIYNDDITFSKLGVVVLDSWSVSLLACLSHKQNTGFSSHTYHHTPYQHCTALTKSLRVFMRVPT
jgi:hypothetical protein